jgi:hypothetical protein
VALIGLEVDDDTALSAVDALEVSAERGSGLALVLVALGQRANASRDLAPWRLHFDDIRAQVGQHHRAVGPCERRRQVDDAQARQRAAHDRTEDGMRVNIRSVRSLKLG